MVTSLPDASLGELVVEQPWRARVFERLGLDYCCGGKATLAEARQQRGLDTSAVVHELSASESDRLVQDNLDSTVALLSDLIDSIVADHHQRLRRELPRLSELMARVLAAHQSSHPELRHLANVLHNLRDHLASHMMKEEQVLFPWIKQLERRQAFPARHCGTVANPIVVMEHEHIEAANALQQMRSLTGGYVPPADACPTYRALLAGLADLESDLHLHVHKENNILFPRARALEADLHECSGR